MRIVRCEKCAAPTPLRDERPPPWCSRCGASFKAAEDANDAAIPADAGGVGAQTRIVFSDRITMPVRTFPLEGPSDAERVSGSPAVPGKTVVQCYRRYRCLPCGCVYQVRFTDHAGSSQTALARATEHLMRRVLTTKDCPCPTCGLVRPDSALRWQISAHATVLILALVVAGGIGALIVSHSPWIKPAAVVASLAAGVAALFHLWVAMTNPNRGRDARRQRAQADVAAGEIEVLAPGSTQDFRDPARPSAGHCLAFLALLLAPLPFLAPIYFHSAHGLPDNPGLSPDVIGPGDLVHVPIPASGLRGIRGHWRASATAQLTNAHEVGGPPQLNANSRSEDWGGSLIVSKPRGTPQTAPVPNVPIDDLYADVYVPDAPALAGQTLRVKLTMNVTYPVARAYQPTLNSYGNAAFEDQTATVSKEVMFHLAAGNDHRVYRATWEYGAAFGALLYFAGGAGLFLLTRGRRPGGYPPELLPEHEPLAMHS